MSAAARVAAFLGAYFAANAINAFMPLWFADRGLSAAAIGQILGAAALLRVLAGPGWGQRRGSPGPAASGAVFRRVRGGVVRVVLCRGQWLPAAAADRRGAGDRGQRDQPAGRFAGAGPGAGRADRIWAGPRGGVGHVHARDGGGGLAAGPGGVLAGAVAASRRVIGAAAALSLLLPEAGDHAGRAACARPGWRCSATPRSGWRLAAPR